MRLSIDIPDDLITDCETVSRELLEAYAVEKFRQVEISHGRLREILGLSIDEANILLKDRLGPAQHDNDYLESSRQILKKLIQKGDDDIEAGRVRDGAEVMAEFKDRLVKLKNSSVAT